MLYIWKDLRLDGPMEGRTDLRMDVQTLLCEDASKNMFDLVIIVVVMVVIVIVMLYYSDQPEFDGKGGNEKMLAEKK